MSETILKVQHLGKSFGNNEILKDIDFSVKPKDVTCIIGPSGSGKSTLLRCMNLLETPSSGEIRYHGTNIMDKHVNVPEYRSKVGMVFQNPDNQIVGTSVEEDVAFGPENKNIEPEKRLELMNNSVEYFENNEEFDLEKFTEKVFDNQEESDKFKVYIDSYDIDNKFSISSNAVTKIKKTIKKCIKLDDNVEIKFSDTVDDIDNLLEKGYDREKKRKYYKIYYNDED